MAKKKTAANRRKVTATKSAAKRGAAKKKPAAARPKKKMVVARAKKKPTPSKVKKKSTTAKAKKKLPVAKAKKKPPVAKVPAEKNAVKKPVKKATLKKRRGRITRMTVQETLISLASLEGSWEEFEWLHGLVLYGPGLRRVAVHREFSFMVVYRGLRNPAQLRQAKADLEKRIRAAVPVKRHLHFVTDFEILRRVEAKDPAFVAVLGHAIAIYVRGSS